MTWLIKSLFFVINVPALMYPGCDAPFSYLFAIEQYKILFSLSYYASLVIRYTNTCFKDALLITLLTVSVK